MISGDVSSSGGLKISELVPSMRVDRCYVGTAYMCIGRYADSLTILQPLQFQQSFNEIRKKHGS